MADDDARSEGPLSVRRRSVTYVANARPGTLGYAPMRRRQDDGDADHHEHEGRGDRDDNDPYLTALAKLFPAEGVAALPLALSIANDPAHAPVRYGLIALITLGIAALRWFATTDAATHKPDLGAVAVAVLSFLLYATAMLAFTGFIMDEATTRIVATVVAIFWVALSPYIVRATPPPA